MKYRQITPDTLISDVCSTRVVNVIKKTNDILYSKKKEIKTLNDLSCFSEMEILLIKGSGEVVLLEIKDLLSRIELTLSEKSKRYNTLEWTHIFTDKKSILQRYNTNS